MSKSIPISPKHGVNPCIPICFFCGQEKNEIALLGKIKGDKEAPKNVVLDYEPCENCKKSMSAGITLIGVETHPLQPNQPEIQKGLYPTGSWCVVSDDFIKRNIQPEEMCNTVLQKRRCFMENEMIEIIISQSEALQNNNTKE